MLLSREEQRAREAHRAMLPIQLWCHLQNLIREIKAGDASKLIEFQQFAQYAPAEMRMKLLEQLEIEDACVDV